MGVGSGKVHDNSNGADNTCWRYGNTGGADPDAGGSIVDRRREITPLV